MCFYAARVADAFALLGLRYSKATRCVAKQNQPGVAFVGETVQKQHHLRAKIYCRKDQSDLQMAFKPSEGQDRSDSPSCKTFLSAAPSFLSSTHALPHSSPIRHEEAGVRRLDMARGLLHLSQLRAADWLQVLHSRQGRALLRGLLRGQVRPSVHTL